MDILSFRYPSVMGILNVTPDSFSDGGKFSCVENAINHANKIISDGATIIDVGGESTRPGASSVSEEEELDRVIPVIESLNNLTDITISIDTSKPVVMREAISAGASMINDVSALTVPGALETAASLRVPVCLMHMQGRPKNMQDYPIYNDVSVDVAAFLNARVNKCVESGIPKKLIIIDPGFGFGKTHDQNIELIVNLKKLKHLGLPILIGLSRKSTLGEITGRDINDRLSASIAAAVIGVLNGANIVRAHDVKETVDALKIATKVMESSQ